MASVRQSASRSFPLFPNTGSLPRQLSDPISIVDLQEGGDALEELVGVQAADHHHRGGLHHEGHEEGQGQDDAPDAD